MNIAIILASGKGMRFGSKIPKQFIEVEGKPLLFYTLEKFENCVSIDEIVVVTSKEYLEEVASYREKYNITKIRAVITGGETRQESSFNGLESLKALGVKDEDIVLIHDGARPMVNDFIINSTIEAAKEIGAALTATKVTDTTVNKLENNVLGETLDRNNIVQVQTPQTFKYKLIYEAHLKAKDNKATDDAQLVTAMGKEVKLVITSEKNLKITTQEDLDYFQYLLKQKR